MYSRGRNYQQSGGNGRGFKTGKPLETIADYVLPAATNPPPKPFIRRERVSPASPTKLHAPVGPVMLCGDNESTISKASLALLAHHGPQDDEYCTILEYLISEPLQLSE